MQGVVQLMAGQGLTAGLQITMSWVLLKVHPSNDHGEGKARTVQPSLGAEWMLPAAPGALGMRMGNLRGVSGLGFSPSSLFHLWLCSSGHTLGIDVFDICFQS